MKSLFNVVNLLLLSYVTKTAGDEDLQFKLDYSFNKQADGWLKLHSIPATWNDAKIRCHAEGAVLASPLSNELREAVLKFVSKDAIDMLFTGVHATFSQGDYASIEGVPLNRLPITWSEGEPNNLDNLESCLAMAVGKGTLADVKCSDVHPYVCYKKKTALAVNECGTHDKEYTLNSDTGSCYKFHKRGLNWSKAYLTCIAEGGHLAIINSHQESLVLIDFYAKIKNKDISTINPGSCFVGFRNMGDGDSWRTIHGETLEQAGFNRWLTGQPDNATTRENPEGENCGSFFRFGLLNDMSCNTVSPFICEKKPSNSKEV